ncbi:MAG: PAS domain S-box protein [Halobacteriales archaeon]|nr:PAS domain S-box protein [Halobacteriales archaeon]
MSSEDYRALFKQANDAIALVEFQDGTPIIEAVNSTFRETFVPDDSDVIGRDIDELVAEGDRREAAITLSQRVRKGEVTREMTARDTVAGVRHFDCQVIPVDAATIEDADRAFAIYTDVTERFERKRALEESEERYRQLVATAPTPILIYDGSEKVVYANDAAVELFGAENEEELLGLTPRISSIRTAETNWRTDGIV